MSSCVHAAGPPRPATAEVNAIHLFIVIHKIVFWPFSAPVIGAMLPLHWHTTSTAAALLLVLAALLPIMALSAGTARVLAPAGPNPNPSPNPNPKQSALKAMLHIDWRRVPDIPKQGPSTPPLPYK